MCCFGARPALSRKGRRHANKLEAWGTAALRWLARKRRQPLWRTRRILAQVHREAGRLAGLDLAGVRARARRGGLRPALQWHHPGRRRARLRAGAAGGRLALGKAHFDVQLLGGWAMLQGMVAEMNTGEGKTLTATLPAATAALAGLPVHVITTNDYLVERDAQIMTPLYQALGLSVAWVSMEMDPAERRRAYRADIVYCSNKTLVFDYLRDLIVLDDDWTRTGCGWNGCAAARGASATVPARPVLRHRGRGRQRAGRRGAHAAHHFGRAGRGRRLTAQAMELAAGMREEHYLIQREHRRAALTESGREHLRLACAACPRPGAFRSGAKS